MKLPNLPRAERTALVFAVAAILLPGCDPDDPAAETDAAATGSQTTNDDSSSSNETTQGTTTTGAGTETDPTATSDGSSSTGPIPEGLGCDPAPPCDKGAYVGNPPIITTIEDANEIAGYTSVTGPLVIANSNFECVEFLNCMEDLGHDLTIFGNDLLTDVTGLDNIAVIGSITEGSMLPGGTLSVSENAALVDFNTLNLIEQTPISLSIAENDSLEAISGLKTMVGTQVNFEIRFNPVLRDIPSDSLRDLLFIGGNCVVTNNASLCISTIEDMCSIGIKVPPQDGSTANNDESC